MGKNLMNICFLIIAGVLLYAAVFTYSSGDIVDSRKENGIAEVWTDRMEKSEQNGSYFYKAVLPKEDIAGKVLAYDSAYMDVQVEIAGETVYSLLVPKGHMVKSNGYTWNVVSLSEEDAGREVEFIVTPNYKDIQPRGRFYYGVHSAVERLIIRERSLRFFVALAILLSGILFKAYDWFIVRKEGQGANLSLRYFSHFTIMLGLWTLCESQFLELFLSQGIVLAFLDHLMLMYMPIPFLLFLRQMYQNQNLLLWRICCYLNFGVAGVRVLLQIFGVFDLRETLWLTQVFLLLFIASVVFLSIHEIVHYQLSAQLWLNIICVLVLMVTTLLELFAYRAQSKGVPLSSIGFLFYIMVMGISSVRTTRMMLEHARESEIYRRLAFVDELTGLYNRTAFNRDKEGRVVADKKTKEENILPTVLYMFDLNDLKKCNDTFGHEYGDQYITMVAEVLKRIFGLEGKCYRIGGDEFCAMMSFRTEHEIKNKLLQFRKAIQEKDRKGFVVPVSVAVGYGIYDAAVDQSLEDTMHRADELMYQDKQRLKPGKQIRA